MVVMFVPGDQFLDAALARRPGLFEDSAKAGVVLATPSSLMGLVRVVEMGWREQRISEQVQQLRKDGADLLTRARVAMEHVADLGTHLTRAVDKYNAFQKSYDSRLRPTLERFQEAYGQAGDAVIDAQIIEARPRAEQTPRLLPPGSE
jgi:DNA recombination protein RmuC